jgi:hypothetical protein
MSELACSWAGFNVKAYDGPKRPGSKVAIITTDDGFVSIRGVDGKETINRKNIWHLFMIIVMEWGPRNIFVAPGEHFILPCYENPYEFICAENWLCIEAEAGRRYVVKSERLEHERDKIRFWIEERTL